MGKVGSHRRVRHSGRAIALAIVGLIVAGALYAVTLGGWTVRPVLSGSMRPGFSVGGVVIAQKEPVSAVAVRDVVIFHPPGDDGAAVVHRVVTIDHNAQGAVITTKGDDNPAADPWRAVLRGHDVYRVRYSLPLLGYPAVWAHSANGRRMTLLAAAALLAVALGQLLLRRRRPRVAGATAAADAPPEAQDASEILSLFARHDVRGE